MVEYVVGFYEGKVHRMFEVADRYISSVVGHTVDDTIFSIEHSE